MAYVVDTYVTDNTYSGKVERVRQENTYVTDNTYGGGRRTSSAYVREQNAYTRKIQRWKTYVSIIRTPTNHVAESRLSAGYVHGEMRTSTEDTYATGKRTPSGKSPEYESRISITESVVGISLTESVVGISITESAVGTRLFAQTSDGPKCSRMLPKQYLFETLRLIDGQIR